MIKLSVKSRNNNNYELINKDNIYNINIRFYDVKKTPEVGDIIYMSENLLDNKYYEYSNSYQFGEINSKYGRDLDTNFEKDIICLVDGDKYIYLKRVFG